MSRKKSSKANKRQKPSSAIVGDEWRQRVNVQRTYRWSFSELRNTQIGWDITCLGHYWSPSRRRWIRFDHHLQLFGAYAHEGHAQDDALGIAFGPQVAGVVK